MKRIWFLIVISFILLLSQATLTYGQEARAYATVLIIIPHQPQQPAQATVPLKESPESTIHTDTPSKEEITLAEVSKEEEIRISE